MTTPDKTGVLLPLVQQLKACPSRRDGVTVKRLNETWACFRTIAPEQGDTITPAVLVGLILYDPEMFASLLNTAEHAQLLVLGKTALEHYEQQLHPPNHLGKIIAEALKEQI